MGIPPVLCSPGPGTCASRPPIPSACAQQPSRPNQARVDGRMACNGQGSTDSVPGCRGAGLLIIQVSRWKDQPAPAGWLAGHWAPSFPKSHGPRLQGFCPMLLTFAFWVRVKSKFQESGRGSFFLASPLPSPHGSCKYIPACLLLLDPSRRPSSLEHCTTATTTSLALFLALFEAC